MLDHDVSRRRLFRTGLGAATAASTAALVSPLQAKAGVFSYTPQLNFIYDDPGPLSGSLDKAYSFLNAMMDAYAQGSTVRLTQSYSDQQGLQSTAFTYDNAVTIHAYLVRGDSGDFARAKVLGNGLLYAQQTDSLNDGRIRQAYFVNAPDAHGVYVQSALAPFYFLGSSVGDLAWAGMALAQLSAATRTSTYLNGAVALGNWIYNNSLDSRGAGGFTGGVDAGNNKLTYKSTEHNLDTYALFLMLARLTGDSKWKTRAQTALNFIASMWNASGGFFWTGTGTDGITTNTANIPEDVQTWSYLALRTNLYAASLDWVTTNLVTIDNPQTINSKLTGNTRIFGETYASLSLRALTPSQSYDQPPDPNAVWLEGTAHTVAALLARVAGNWRNPENRRYLELAVLMIDNIQIAQRNTGIGQTVGGIPIAPAEGIIAASSVLNGGFGSSYYPNLHIGATGWFALAAQMADPFRLGYQD